MSVYHFSVIVRTSPMTHEEILDATDALADAGCGDASIRGHTDGMELLFERSGESFQDVIASAISDVENAGHAVSRVEIERECIPL